MPQSVSRKKKKNKSAEKNHLHAVGLICRNYRCWINYQAVAMRDTFEHRLLTYGADLAGAAIGFTAEFLQAVPAGAGGPLSSPIASVIKEMGARFLGARERTRITAVTDVAIHRIRARLLSQHIYRTDGFFRGVNNDRSPSEELLESVLLKARDSFEEKKVRHLGLFYANLVFAADVSPQTAHLLLKLFERITYRQLCLIALVGQRGTIDFEALRRPDQVDPEVEALKREEMELHLTDIGTIGLLSSVGSWTDELSLLGKLMYDLAGLQELESADKTTLESIIRSVGVLI